MAVALYSVARDDVLKRLPNWKPHGSALPSYDTIDTDGQILNASAAKVADLLQKGGHGLAPDVTLADTPVAYYRIREVIIQYAAYLYTIALKSGTDDQRQTWLEQIEEMFEELRSGEAIGELSSPTDSQRSGAFKHGDTTRTELSTRRFTANMVM